MPDEFDSARLYNERREFGRDFLEEVRSRRNQFTQTEQEYYFVEDDHHLKIVYNDFHHNIKDVAVVAGRTYVIVKLNQHRRHTSQLLRIPTNIDPDSLHMSKVKNKLFITFNKEQYTHF